MKRTLLYSFITAILLVPLFGVQAMAQETYILPENSGTVTMAEILIENPELKGKMIYGDIIRDNEGNPADYVSFYGGTVHGVLKLNESDRYGTENPNISFGRDNKNGLTLTSKDGNPIKEAKLFLAEDKGAPDGWCKTENIIILKCQDDQAGKNSKNEETKDSTQQTGSQINSEPSSPSKPMPWWAWLICGFIVGVVLSYILMRKIVAFNRKTTTDEKRQVQFPENQLTSGEKSLNIGEVEQVVKQIVENHSSELYTKLSKKIDDKFVNLGTERKVQNNTTPIFSTPTRHLKETRTIQKEATEEFCGYAQLPQNGDFALTLTQDPARTAFVISKRGSNYLVGLIDDEQTLSQLVQPLSDLKANGSNIVDFPEGELQGAQKIVCVDRGIFKEESTGRIIPVKPIQIKRG